MDLLKLALSTSSIKNAVSKLIGKAIYLKTGHHVDIDLNDIMLKNENGKVKLHVNTDLYMNTEEFLDILEKFTNV